MKPKKILCVSAILLMLVSFTACAECIDTKQETVEVVITDAHYEGEWTQFIHSDNSMIPIIHSAEYIITVEYNGVEHDIHGEDVYKAYKDRVGETVEAVLEIRAYDNGTVKYDILSLEG